MSLNRTDLINRFIKVRSKYVTLNWGQFASSIAALTADQRSQLLIAINNEDADALALLIVGIVKAAKVAQATNDVNTLIAGNSLTLDQMLTVLE